MRLHGLVSTAVVHGDTNGGCGLLADTSILQLFNCESLAASNTTVVLHSRASYNRSQITGNWSGGNACRLRFAGLRTALLTRRLVKPRTHSSLPVFCGNARWGLCCYV